MFEVVIVARCTWHLCVHIVVKLRSTQLQTQRQQHAFAQGPRTVAPDVLGLGVHYCKVLHV